MILKRTFVMLVALFGLTFSAVTLSGGDSYPRTSDLQRGLLFAQIAPLVVPAPKSAPDQLPTGASLLCRTRRRQLISRVCPSESR